MAKSFYTVEKEINGVKYTAQFSGMSTALRAIDESYIDGSDNTSLIKLSSYIFEHVIVEPKGLTVDDFDSMQELRDVTDWAQEVMQGKFRPSAVEGKSKK